MLDGSTCPFIGSWCSLVRERRTTCWVTTRVPNPNILVVRRPPPFHEGRDLDHHVSACNEGARACGGGGGAAFGPAPISLGGGVGAAKGLLPCFLVPKGNQPRACTLALWWLKYRPTEHTGGGGGVGWIEGWMVREFGGQLLGTQKEAYVFHDPFCVNYNLKDDAFHVEAPPYESSLEPAIPYVVFLLDNKERKRSLDKIYVEDFFHKCLNQSLSNPLIETLEEHGIPSDISNSIIVDVNPTLLQYGTSERGLSQFLEVDLTQNKSVEEFSSRDTIFSIDGIFLHSFSPIEEFVRFTIMLDKPILLELESKLHQHPEHEKNILDPLGPKEI